MTLEPFLPSKPPTIKQKQKRESLKAICLLPIVLLKETSHENTISTFLLFIFQFHQVLPFFVIILTIITYLLQFLGIFFGQLLIYFGRFISVTLKYNAQSLQFTTDNC